MDTNDTATVEGTAFTLPAHLEKVFNKAEQLLTQTYGVSPAVPNLICMWLACATPGRVLKQFEDAAMDIQTGNVNSAQKYERNDDPFSL